MRIALNISPLFSGHKVRGAGFYVERLKEAYLKYYSKHEYVFFTRISELNGKFDVVHYPFFDPFFLTAPVFKRSPLVVTIHDLIPLIFPQHFPAGIKGKIKWQIQKILLSRTDAVITDSISSKKDISRVADIHEDKTHVIYLSAGEEFRQLKNSKNKSDEIRRKYNLPSKFVLYVGDATWNKNLVNLIKAIEKTDIQLVMVGKALVDKNIDGHNIWNKDLIESKNLIHNKIQFITLGFLPTEDLVAIYNCATVAILPSFYEGFGLPIVEAMKSGCPVIASDRGSIPEVAGDAVLYIDPYNINNISETINRLCKDAELRRRLIRKGFIQADKFSWKKTAENTIALYEKIKKNY